MESPMDTESRFPSSSRAVMPQGSAGGCACGGAGAATQESHVYAIGRIEARFPRISVEKEFHQAAGRADSAGLTDRETFHSVMTRRENRYLVPHLCWVMSIEGVVSYLLIPRDPNDLDLLLESIRPTPRAVDVDVVIGARGPLAPAEMCNGLIVPMVGIDQVYSFNVEQLITAIPRPERIDEARFKSASEELFYRIMQMSDNAGATDEHRALNYLAVRYQAIFATAAECFSRDFWLSDVEVRASRLSGTRTIMDVIFGYTNRNTDVREKFFVRVDVTDRFPFLVSKLQPYFDR